MGLLLLTSVLFALAGCGGDSSTVTTSPGPFSVGGIVTGLAAGNTLALSNNGTDLLTLNANGAFVFLAKLTSAGTFRVTVASATQNCSVTAGAGTIRYIDVTGVTVTCGPGTFTAAASLAQARYSHTATLLPDGKVLAVGGFDDTHAVATAERYDPATKTWSAAGAMATPRYLHTATLLPNGKVLVSGGISVSTAVPTNELYDPATNTWTAAGPMIAPRFFHTATLLADGKVLVSGGVNDASGKATVASAELYDPSSNSWSVVGSMAQPRNRHSASLLSNGKVLVIGGVELGAVSGETVIATAELYDPVAKTWSSAGAMSAPREKHTATVLTNGQILLSGGVKATTAVTTVEFYF